MEELKHFKLNMSWKLNKTGVVHGIASWFTLDLQGVTLSTAPGIMTHWQQCRFLVMNPVAANIGENFRASLDLNVNEHRSYSIKGGLEKAGLKPEVQIWQLNEQSYYYESQQVDMCKLENIGIYEEWDDESEDLEMQV